MSGILGRLARPALQIAASVALLALVAWVVDLRLLWQRLLSADPLWIAVGLAIGIVQLILLGRRWEVLSRALHLAPQLVGADYLALVALSYAASQVLPSSIGGDAVRIVAMRRSWGVPLSACVVSVACDRIAGLAGILVLASGMLAAAALAAGGLPPAAETAAQAGLVLMVLLTGLVVAGPHLARWGPVARLAGKLDLATTLDAAAGLLRDPVACARILLLSVLPHALNIIVAFCAARALGLSIPLIALAAALPVAILAMTLPISFAGWGVREAVVVFALGLAGVPKGEALAMSVMWGVLISVLALAVLAPAAHTVNRRRNALGRTG